MPGPLLHLGASVLCAHGGAATPTAPNARVLVSGQPSVVMTAPYAIAGCPFNVSGGAVPCVTAQWVVAATRVFDFEQQSFGKSTTNSCFAWNCIFG